MYYFFNPATGCYKIFKVIYKLFNNKYLLRRREKIKKRPTDQ